MNVTTLKLIEILEQVIIDVTDCETTGESELFYERMLCNKDDAQVAVNKAKAANNTE